MKQELKQTVKPTESSTAPHLDDPIHDRLRRLNIEDPPAALRVRTFRAVDEELERRTGRRNSTAWTVEWAFAAAILVGVLILPSGSTTSSEAPPATVTTDEIVEQIGLDEDLADSLRFRQSFSQEPSRGRIEVDPNGLRGILH